MSSKSAGFFKGTVRKFFPICFDNDMGTRCAFGMEPPVISGCGVESEFFILQIVLSYIHMVTIGREKMKWFIRNFHFLFREFSADVACSYEFFLDFSQVIFGTGDIQCIADGFQIGDFLSGFFN